MEEVWKDINGYEGIYSISNKGNVWSHKSKKMLKPYIEKKGYHSIKLGSYERKAFKVHRLVAIHFVKNDDNYDQVNHMDGDKNNNRFDNLEWCDCGFNVRHALKTGLRIPRNGSNINTCKLSEENVLSIRKEYAAGNISQRKLAEKYGVVQTTIKSIVNNKSWKQML